jgi:hypothetical protein
MEAAFEKKSGREPDRKGGGSMKSKMVAYMCLVIFGLFVFISCATTTLTAVWKGESYKGPVKKMAVIGVSDKPVIRNLFEDEFVRELRARGTDAVASYTVLPIDRLADKGIVQSKIRETGADAVLMIRLVDMKSVQTYVPGQVYVMPNYYHGWSGYYGNVFATPGYAYQDEYAYLETNLYDVKTEQLIWSARSETWMADSDQSTIKSFIGVIIARLAADKIIQ